MSEFFEQTFNGKGKTLTLEKGEYESCHFIDCVFTNHNFSNFSFSDCTFERCDLSSSAVQNTSFKEVNFIDCKILGVQFENANPFLFEVEFNDCQLNLSSFYQVNLKQTNFNNCNLKEVDFTETNLSEAKFNNCDLSLAVFDQTDLSKADLSTAFQFIIDPTNNNVKKAKFSKEGVLGLLVGFDVVVN